MHFDLPLPALTLQCGARLPGLHVRGWAAGPGLDPLTPVTTAGRVVRRHSAELTALWGGVAPRLPAAPTVLVMHALTGDAQAGGEGGWWGPLIGPGKVFDTDWVRVIGFNHLGSCYGTYGPADAGFPRWADVPEPPALGNLPEPPAWRPAPITAWDQARVTLLALDALGIEQIECVAGGSIGGNLALCMQVLAPARFGRVTAVGCATRSSAWILGWNHLGRQAVLADPDGGLVRARAAAHLSYRAEPGLEARQGRRVSGPPFGPYAMQTYLQHHGLKLQKRFDPAAYVAMLDGMDHHDLAVRPRRDPVESWAVAEPWGEARLHDVHGVGIDSDQLFHPEHLRDLCARVPGGTYAELHSAHGHDAFLMHWDVLPDLLEPK